MAAWISWDDLSSLIGLAAFALAGASLWFGTIRPHREATRRAREAHLAGRFESYMFGNEVRFRVGIKNVGTAEAKDVSITVTRKRTGDQLTNVATGFLRPHSKIYLPLPPEVDGLTSVLAALEWTDGAGTHSKEYEYTRQDLV